MRIAFYRACAGNWLDHLIDRLSGRLGFSHVELVFPGGASFSSTSRDRSVDLSGRSKPNGTRWKRIDFAEHPERWEIVDFPGLPRLDAREILRMHCFADRQLDARYDWRGVVRLAPGMGWVGDSPSRWFCSEVVIAALQSGGAILSLKPKEFSPNSLARLLGVA